MGAVMAAAWITPAPNLTIIKTNKDSGTCSPQGEPTHQDILNLQVL